jgi:hypothetical protein
VFNWQEDPSFLTCNLLETISEKGVSSKNLSSGRRRPASEDRQGLVLLHSMLLLEWQDDMRIPQTEELHLTWIDWRTDTASGLACSLIAG